MNKWFLFQSYALKSKTQQFVRKYINKTINIHMLLFLTTHQFIQWPKKELVKAIIELIDSLKTLLKVKQEPFSCHCFTCDVCGFIWRDRFSLVVAVHTCCFWLMNLLHCCLLLMSSCFLMLNVVFTDKDLLLSIHWVLK